VNWEAIGAIGEVLGALFVFCSLLYLVLEVRNNSRVTRSSNINSEADQIQKLADLQGRTAMMTAMKKVYVGGETEPDFHDAAMLEAYYLSTLSIAQAQFQHKAAGLKSNWEPYKRLVASTLAPEYARKWWTELGSTLLFEESFIDEVNRIMNDGYDGDFWTKYGDDASTDA
jgi:hypothetical protein